MCLATLAVLGGAVTGCQPPETSTAEAGDEITSSGVNARSDEPRAVVRVRDITIRAEIADTEAERAVGLMGRPSVPPGEGMIFVFDGPTRMPFYMYRTLAPLSIMFVRDGRVVSVREMTPCPELDPSACPFYSPAGPYTHAVEARAGTFSSVRPDDAVTIRRR
ncbi:MAG: DUF192 domain-containing protein [Frankia sp.]|nr:DUF192 domain-containing protein [Frankia sp.]